MADNRYSHRGSALALLAACLGTGCFSAGISDGQYACSPDGLCPTGFVCGEDGLCRAGASGAADAGKDLHTSGDLGGDEGAADRSSLVTDLAGDHAAARPDLTSSQDLDQGGPPGSDLVDACTVACNTPVILAEGQPNPISLAVDQTHVYWSNNDRAEVMAVPKTGGSAVIIADNQTNPAGITVDGSTLYWVNNGDSNGNNGQVMRLSLMSGSAPEVLIQSLPQPNFVAVAASNLYWVDLDVSDVRWFSPTVNASTTLSTQGGTWTLAVAHNRVFWANQQVNSIQSIAGDGSEATSTTVLMMPGTPLSIVASGSSIFWVADDGSVGLTNLDGSAKLTLAMGQARPVAVAADNNGLYWLNQGVNGGPGQLMSLPATGPPQVLASQQDGPLAIAIDDTFVYWSVHGSGTDGLILKLAR